MLVDGNLITDLGSVAARVGELEDLGYDGAVGVETSHDPFLPIAMAAEHSSTIELLTEVAIALARSPMTVAYTAHDLNVYSGGRFVLGIGSQTPAHITKRFSMPWSAPAARMREFIIALQAIWDAWATGEPLKFRGEFYQHTLMTPFFNPGESPYGRPRVFLGALGSKMAEVAGEVADGILVHPMATDRYMREVSLPAIERGLAQSGRSRDKFTVGITPFVISGEDENAIAEVTAAVRLQVAFYGSTPAYKPVLELHGWGDLQPELNTLSKQGRWAEMGELISDEMLDAFAIRAPLEEVPSAVARRFGGIPDRLSLNLQWGADRDRWRAFIAALRQSLPTGVPAATAP
ncbi:MAG: TIGR03617 family F420-dependent LLM class oxidoreductase [Candidatus Dormiibacterota bacterium]